MSLSPSLSLSLPPSLFICLRLVLSPPSYSFLLSLMSSSLFFSPLLSPSYPLSVSLSLSLCFSLSLSLYKKRRVSTVVVYTSAIPKHGRSKRGRMQKSSNASTQKGADEHKERLHVRIADKHACVHACGQAGVRACVRMCTSLHLWQHAMVFLRHVRVCVA